MNISVDNANSLNFQKSSVTDQLQANGIVQNRLRLPVVCCVDVSPDDPSSIAVSPQYFVIEPRSTQQFTVLIVPSLARGNLSLRVRSAPLDEPWYKYIVSSERYGVIQEAADTYFEQATEFTQEIPLALTFPDIDEEIHHQPRRIQEEDDAFADGNSAELPTEDLVPPDSPPTITIPPESLPSSALNSARNQQEENPFLPSKEETAPAASSGLRPEAADAECGDSSESSSPHAPVSAHEEQPQQQEEQPAAESEHEQVTEPESEPVYQPQAAEEAVVPVQSAEEAPEPDTEQPIYPREYDTQPVEAQAPVSIDMLVPPAMAHLGLLSAAESLGSELLQTDNIQEGLRKLYDGAAGLRGDIFALITSINKLQAKVNEAILAEIPVSLKQDNEHLERCGSSQTPATNP